MKKVEEKRTILLVEGMNCTNCALGIIKQLEKAGYENVNADFVSCQVSFDDNDYKKAAGIIKKLGYKVVENSSLINDQPKTLPLEKLFWGSLIFTVPLILSMFIPIPILHNPYFQLLLALPVYMSGVWYFGRSAIGSLRTGIMNMDVLVVLGSSAAFFYSLSGTIWGLGHEYQFYETAAGIISLIFLGNLLEYRAVKKTTSAVEDLMKLQKISAHKIINISGGQEKFIDISFDEISNGDNLLVNQGEKIPTDGILLSLHASIDESMMSGESIPADKRVGDEIIGGTILISDSVRMIATATGHQTVLSQIIELVKNARNDKPSMQSLADKISSVFVPLVLIIAVITFIITYFFTEVSFQQSFMNSIAVLVIACPCALGLAIPTAVVAGIGNAAGKGILVKGASTLQKIINAKYIVFDKTGTLTTGFFRISQISTFGNDASVARNVLLSLERYSSHPIAKSVVENLADAETLELSEISEIKGIGISGRDVDGNIWTVGSSRILNDEMAVDSFDIYLLKNNKIYAALNIEDEIKDEAGRVIDFFNKKGIKTVLVSGDKKNKCELLAEKTGIQKIYYEKLPQQKLEIIEELSKSGETLMVGDGINDAPALSKASTGISFGSASQIAIQSAQLILLNNNLALLIKAYIISNNTMKIIKQNLFWAFFYNILVIPFAAIGFLNPMIAAGIMAISDVIVVLNSLRLRRMKL